MKTTQAIERVCDKRHARLCATMPENQAAGLVVRYLDSLKTVHKANGHVLHFIAALRAGYSL